MSMLPRLRPIVGAWGYSFARSVPTGSLPLPRGHSDPPFQCVLPDKKGGTVLVTLPEQGRGEVGSYPEAGPQQASCGVYSSGYL